MSNAFKKEFQGFGIERLRIIQLINHIIISKQPKLKQIIIEYDFIPTFLVLKKK